MRCLSQQSLSVKEVKIFHQIHRCLSCSILNVSDDQETASSYHRYSCEDLYDGALEQDPIGATTPNSRRSASPISPAVKWPRQSNVRSATQSTKLHHSDIADADDDLNNKVRPSTNRRSTCLQTSHGQLVAYLPLNLVFSSCRPTYRSARIELLIRLCRHMMHYGPVETTKFIGLLMERSIPLFEWVGNWRFICERRSTYRWITGPTLPKNCTPKHHRATSQWIATKKSIQPRGCSRTSANLRPSIPFQGFRGHFSFH